MKFIASFTIILLALTFHTGVLYGQGTFEVSPEPVLKTKEDYTKHEATFIEAAQWLETTPLDVETKKRKLANAFVVAYLSGSPTVTITMGNALLDLFDKNSDLMIIYMASYGRHTLANKGVATTATATRAGLVSALDVYKRDVLITKDKDMLKLVKMDDAALEGYIASKLL